jgi:hypothetical protein
MIFIVALVCSSAFADGIVLKNDMQLVVTICDTSGDSISIQEGLYAGKIAKSLIVSFWYKGYQYSYINKTTTRRSVAAIASTPDVRIVSPEPVSPLVHDSSISNSEQKNNVKDSTDTRSFIQASLPDTLSPVTISQAIDTTNQEDLMLQTPLSLKDTGTVQQNEQVEPTVQTELNTDIALEESDKSNQHLFDPEYTNEELAAKKRVFQTLLGIGCAMGVTSTIVFITIETIDVKMIAVPFMIASIPLSIVGGKKSNEYIKRYRSAENKKRRAQMSLSLQLNRADLTIKF